jgi:lipopolysaccharide export system protein LptA
MISRFLIAAASALLLSGAASGQTTSANPFESFSGDMDKPIAISADQTSADFEASTATYSGNVRVEQGTMRMRADTLSIVAPDGVIQRIEARGNVVLVSESGSASGAVAVYDVAPRIIVMTGNVVLTQDQNVMKGSELRVELQTGQAKLTAAPGPDGKPGRVTGVFLPATEPPKPPKPEKPADAPAETPATTPTTPPATTP